MSRRTKKDVLAVQHLINKTLTKYGHPQTVSIVQVASAYSAKYIVCLKDDDGQSRISPRMSIKPIRIWLWAFYKGLTMGITIRKEQ